MWVLVHTSPFPRTVSDVEVVTEFNNIWIQAKSVGATPTRTIGSHILAERYLPVAMRACAPRFKKQGNARSSNSGPTRSSSKQKPPGGHPRDTTRTLAAGLNKRTSVPAPRPTQEPGGHARGQGPSLATPAPQSGARAHSRRVGRPHQSTE